MAIRTPSQAHGTPHPAGAHLAGLLAFLLGALLLVPGGAGRAAEAAPGLPFPILLQTGGGAKEKKKPKTAPAKPKPPPSGAASPRAGENAPPPAGGAAPEPAEASLTDKVVAFIREYATWIVAGLGALLAVIIAGTLLSGRGKRSGGEGGLAEIGLGEEPSRSAAPAPMKRFSSTKIQASDVNNRLARSVKTTEVETDREYALIVDEEALKMPPLPEDESDRVRGTSEALQKLLEDRDLEGAYSEYARRVASDPKVEFDPALERTLSELLLKARDLDKAARVLEHHVATHGGEDIRPDAYFNLGYIHFMKRTLKKSSRFLKLFLKAEKNPAYLERARRILEKIESSGKLN